MSLVHVDQSQKEKEGAEWGESQTDRETERIKNMKKAKGRPVLYLLGSQTYILLTWKNESREPFYYSTLHKSGNPCPLWEMRNEGMNVSQGRTFRLVLCIPHTTYPNVNGTALADCPTGNSN